MLIILQLLFLPGVNGQGTQVTISAAKPQLTLTQQMIPWYLDKSNSVSLSTISDKTFDAFPAKDFLTVKANWCFFTRFAVVNKTEYDKDYVLLLPKTGKALVQIKTADGITQQLQTGSTLKFGDRSVASNINAVKFVLAKNSVNHFVIQFSPVYSVYIPENFTMHLQELALFTKTDTRRLFWQGIFLGIIMVMALYNFIIFIAVKDSSYFYYVLSILSIGIYFTFYYGFGMEYVWPDQPNWDTYCYTLIVPFTAIARLLFTRTYLQTPQQMPGINKAVNSLLVACSVTLILGLIIFIYQVDLLKPFKELIGVLGTLVLLLMLVAGIKSYAQLKYIPALYFVMANLILIVGAIAFILREMSFLQDNFITRYVVQIGVLVQVVVFALGLASRYNQTKNQLAMETLEKERLMLDRERDKQQLIKKQKEELQLQVARQTADLQLQNISLAESREKLSQLNQVKDKLFSIISHDLRNPLATMQSYLKLIAEHQDKLSGVEKQRLMQEAKESADNMNHLLYNLLQWSKSQMNLLPFLEEALPIKFAIEKNIRLLHPFAQLKQIKIEWLANTQAKVMADKDMMDFVLRNLLSNAIKFSHKNSVVQIQVSETETALSIQVIDYGIGLTTVLQQQIMHSNAVVSKRGTAKEKGSGLGLMICKEFIEKNNGRLQVQSVPGEKTVFGFTLKKVTTSVFVPGVALS